MSEPIDWLDDGTASGAPYSPRFGDRYRSELGGLEQARDVFLAGCGLPAAWASKAQWSILETGFGLGLNFLVTWAAWKADPLRPRLLHFVSTEAFPASAKDVLRSAAAHPSLLPLATELQAQLWGLLPGFHRLVFEEGRVLLTLCIGDAKAMLRQQPFEADSVYLDGFSPQKNPDIWDVHTFKAVARCCRRGTRIATWTIARAVRDGLAQAGFVVRKTPGIPPKRDNLQGEYNPAWEPKKPARSTQIKPRQPGSCVVVGAGLAGAAVAASLARRGWRVMVLDAASAPASGASGLPAGLLVPHVSPDDSLLSRLSRSGVRLALQQAHALLERGTDWSHTGVLQHSVDGSNKTLPQTWPDAGADWSRIAKPERLVQCGLPASAQALWHAQAAWIKPAQLVKAWLKTPGIEWRGQTQVARLQSLAEGWQLMDDTGYALAQADLVVLASSYASRALAASVNPVPLALQPIRGQVSWTLHTAQEQGLPPFPVNGHGSLVPAVPVAGGLALITGASYERDCALPGIKPQDDLDNLARLQTLLPQAATHMARAFAEEQVRHWAGIRCATPNRLPVLGPIASSASGAQVWVCTGMGSRGLTFAGLCAELLAARLHGEPLPLELRLAQAMELTGA
ncbi:MAG: FAD-dependent 5-carboxymethylaminomethyl-2-thiouridine(34) oxidoreductase MnmC [Pseudomonadota bacterium]